MTSDIKRPKQEQKRVNVDFPLWMIDLLDKEAKDLVFQDNLLLKSGLQNALKGFLKINWLAIENEDRTALQSLIGLFLYLN